MMKSFPGTYIPKELLIDEPVNNNSNIVQARLDTRPVLYLQKIQVLLINYGQRLKKRMKRLCNNLK